MLTLTLRGREHWNRVTEKFEYPDLQTLQFEHSLVSLSKWEQKYERPFLAPGARSGEEVEDYVRCMLLTPDVTAEQLSFLTEEDMHEIDAYINKPMTGTSFGPARPGKSTGEIISAELIIYWMNTFGIEPDAKHWHLNQLFALIRIHDVKSRPPEKVAPKDRMAQQRALNEARRAKTGSNG